MVALMLLVLLLVVQQHPADGSHFRGATIMVRPVDSPDSPYMMEISFQISWRRDSGEGGRCDDNTIQQGSLIGSGNLDCFSGCSGKIGTMQYVCTDYSTDENWSFGERQLQYDFAASASGDPITIGFKGSAWIAPFNSDWYIPTRFSLARRNDTGRINSTPRAKTAPVIRLQQGCDHTLNLAVNDPDGDDVRCRWAESGECGSVCNKFTGASLDPNTCSFKYLATQGTGYKAAAIMLEDFLSGGTTPLSSVALQFLIYVFPSDSPCSSKPEPVYPTLLNGACVAIRKGSSFFTQIIMASGGKGVTIKEIQTVSPSGMIKGPLKATSLSGVFFVNITWTPSDKQLDQIHQLCYTASNSAGLSSEQACVEFMAGSDPPHISNQVPNADFVHPSETTWNVTFDRDVGLPTIKGLVQFHEYATDRVVHTIDASDSLAVRVINHTTLQITPNFHFDEKKKYYITLGQGVVTGKEGCGPGNEPQTDKDFWTFTTLDVTPPSLWFTSAPLYANENVTLEWMSNEVITEECLLVTDITTEEVNCNNQHRWSMTGLKEGTYVFIVDVKDEADNAARLKHKFNVDKTPPTAIITTAPDQFTKSSTTTIYFNCDKPGRCTFKCMFYDVSKSDVEMVSCNSRSFRTPQMQADSEYLFGVQATDDVGNVGSLIRTTWIVDQEAPTILDLSDDMRDCTGNLDPDITGRPQVEDNMDLLPILSHRDQHHQCYLLRTWTAQDKAGNIAQKTQNITLTFQPVINALPVVYFTCDSAIATVDVPANTASVDNPCGRPLEMTYTDSTTQMTCPIKLTRTWTVLDTCTHVTEVFSQNVVVNDVCPIHACGRHFSKPHGICTFGECHCIKPWYGNECETQIHEPRVESVLNTSFQEGEDYDLEPKLLEGTPPLTWKLTMGPVGMSIDLRSGAIQWPRITAGVHHIKVEVENQAGKTQVTWTIQVNPTYTPRITNVVNLDGAFLITGKTDFEPGSIIKDILKGIVPVNIDIESDEPKKTIKVFTKPDGNFATMFYPAPGQYGTFSALARHPSIASGNGRLQWQILGMRVDPSVFVLNDESTGPFQGTFSNVATLINDGPSDLNDIHGEALLGTLASHLQVMVLLDGKENLDVLKITQQINITIKINTTRPMSATFSVALKADSGVSRYLNVKVDIVHTLPDFLINPPVLDARMIYSESKIFTFNITNVGKVEASSVSISIPENNLISLVGFGNDATIGNSISLPTGKSISLEILVQIPSDQSLGEINGKMTVYGKETSKSIPFKILVTSNVKLDLTIKVEDEYTYFAEGKPLVDDAIVRLDNYQRNIHLSQTTTQGRGKTTFKNIPEDRYELSITAPGHQDKKIIIVTDNTKQEMTVFLERTGVNYQFSVTPVQIEDTYQITLEADFETQVPMPVVTITPTEVDLTDIEQGYQDTIQYNVTNHGLIRAENVTFDPPTGHPFLEFIPDVKDLGPIEAQTSIIVNVKVVRKARQKRYWIWVAYGFKVLYNFFCGEWQWRNAIGVLMRREWREVLGYVGRVSFPGGTCKHCSGFNFRGYTATTPDYCDPCMQAMVNCIPAPPNIPGLDCIPALASGSFPKPTLSTSNIITTAGWLNCVPGNPVASVLICGAGLIDGCLRSGGSSRRKKRALKDNVQDLAEALYPVILSKDLATEILGSEKWIKIGDPEWYSSVLTPILDDASDAGPLISAGEFERVENTRPPDGATLDETLKMVQRLNATMVSWNSGHLEPNEGENIASFSKYEEIMTNITTYNEKAKDKGFTSYLDAYSFAAAQIKKASSWEDEEGVCAVVRIRIEQEAALTREGFLAKLDIENKETSELKNIEIEIIIKDSASGEIASSRFSIGDPSLIGDLTGVDGNGVLPSNRDGTSEWLIIPYSEAAPTADKLYDVGGKLLYKIDGEQISINLWPTSINVKPDPSLRIHYFWDKYVISDDPFTPEKEPAVPFTLGVAVKNTGYGTAYDMHITSAQPEIISNEKGLLVSFQIVSSRVGNEPISPSLTVNFGDIGPNKMSIARWWIVSSLQGEFRNYSATFENTNPLGDPKLSLIDELEIHQLIRNVRLYDIEDDDGVSDFLTNEWKDLDSYPDTLYSSNSLTPHNVTAGKITSTKLKFGQDGSISVSIQASANASGLTYFRSKDLKHSLSSFGFLLLETSLAVTRVQDNANLPMENSWLTVSHRKDKSIYLHILDILPSKGTFGYDIKLCTDDCPLRNATEVIGLPPKVIDVEKIYAIKENFSIPEELTTQDLVFSTTPLPTKPSPTTNGTKQMSLCSKIVISCVIAIFIQLMLYMK